MYMYYFVQIKINLMFNYPLQLLCESQTLGEEMGAGKPILSL